MQAIYVESHIITQLALEGNSIRTAEQGMKDHLKLTLNDI